MNKSVHIYVVKLRSKMQLDPQDFGVSRVIFVCVVVFCVLACLSVCLIELMFAHTHTPCRCCWVTFSPMVKHACGL